MIDHQEIMDFSREFGLATNVIEKDNMLKISIQGSIACSGPLPSGGDPPHIKVVNRKGCMGRNS